MVILKKGAILLAAVMMVITLSSGVWAEKAADAKKIDKVEKININTATAEEMTVLKLIGPKIAERIVEYRKSQGVFKQPEDIMNVKGIGEKAYEVNKDLIAVK